VESKKYTKLINFLLEELAIPDTAISLALRDVEQTPSFLPMVLWQYGRFTVTQLNQIFDWLEVAS